VRRLFGNAIGSLSMSSTKSAIGHLLGGAGAVESIFCILAMRAAREPATDEAPSVKSVFDGIRLIRRTPVMLHAALIVTPQRGDLSP